MWCHIKRKGPDWMFNVPNYLMNFVRKTTCFINEEVRLTARREALIETLESDKQNKQKEKGEITVENFTFDQL